MIGDGQIDLRQLVALHGKAGEFFDRVANQHSQHMVCQKGCSGCCHQSLSLFPVELARLKPAVMALEGAASARLRARLHNAKVGDDQPCPLLDDDRCVVYDARPTICRTHGAPIQFRRDEQSEPERDVCPLNFDGELALDDLPVSDLLDIDRLNALLALTNRLTLESAGIAASRESLGGALRRWFV